MFSWTSRNSHASDQGIKGISGIILANCEWSVSSIRGLRICHVCLWSVGGSSWCCYEQETLCAAQPEALANTCFNWLSRKKSDICSVKVCKGKRGWVSFWDQEAHLLRHAQIVLPIKGPQGNYCIYCLICIHLFYFLFILSLFFHVIVFFLFNPHIYELLYSHTPSFELNSITAVLQGGLLHYITNKGWYAIWQKNQAKPKETIFFQY